MTRVEHQKTTKVTKGTLKRLFARRIRKEERKNRREERSRRKRKRSRSRSKSKHRSRRRSPSKMPKRKRGPQIGDCPNCMTAKHIITDFQQGDMVCRNCGLVLEDRIIDDSPEWRTFASESAGLGAGEDKSRATTAVDEHFGTLGGTEIAGGTATALGKAQAILSNQTATEKNVSTCKKNLRLIADAMSLAWNVIDGCYDLIKSMEEQGALKGRTNLVNMCAVVYIVCRDMPSVARSLREIAAGCVQLETKKLTVDQYARDIGRAMMKIRRNVKTQATAGKSSGPVATDLIPRFSNYLNLKHDTVALAEKLATNCMKNTALGNRWPQNIAGTCIFLAAILLHPDIDLTLTEVAETLKLKEGTLRSTYKDLRQVVQQLLPEDHTFKKEALEKLPV